MHQQAPDTLIRSVIFAILAAVPLLAAVPMVVTVTMMIVTVIATIVIPALTMMFLIARNIFTLIPVVLNKIDSLAARVICAAMLAPIFGMPWRNTHIDWSAVRFRPLDIHRLPVYKLWPWVITDIDLAIKSRLANSYRHSNVGREYLACGSDQCCCDE